jgi:eukaryotic-like serine/threonine-protein kinase
MTATSEGLDGAAAGVGAVPEATAVAAATPDSVLSDPAIRARYRVVETIVPGPEDALYLARRLDTGAPVELRVLSGGLGGDRVLQAAVVQHATLVARVYGQCPGIAALYECERTSSGLFLAMEHPEGPTLREVIKREGTLGLDRALRLALGLARVLERVHNLGLVHGGLRPEHIVLVGPEEEVVLTHFGFDWVLLSRSPDARGRQASPPEDSAYPAYQAPEQAWEQATTRSDIYAFGAILYEMLAGTPPPAATASRPRVNPESLKNCRADVTPTLERIVMQALQVAPERRLADISAVVNALTTEMSADRLRQSTERTTGADSSAGTRMKRLLGWSGITVLGVLAIWFAHTRMASDTRSSKSMPPSTPSTVSTLGTPAVEPTKTAPADVPGPGVAPRATDASGTESPAGKEPAPPPVASRTSPPAERSADARDAQKPRTDLPSGPVAVTPPKPAAVTPPKPAAVTPSKPEAVMPPKPAESPAMTKRPATRADDVATTTRQAAPAAPQPKPSRETSDAGEDPGAIIDWLLNEGSAKER